MSRTFADHAGLLLAAFSTLGSLASSRPHHDAIQREGAVGKVASVRFDTSVSTT